MTRMTREEFDRRAFQQPDDRDVREARAKADTRQFWGLWVPLGAMVGFFACVVGNSTAYFIPVAGVTAFVLWAALGREK